MLEIPRIHSHIGPLYGRDVRIPKSITGLHERTRGKGALGRSLGEGSLHCGRRGRVGCVGSWGGGMMGHRGIGKSGRAWRRVGLRHGSGCWEIRRPHRHGLLILTRCWLEAGLHGTRGVGMVCAMRGSMRVGGIHRTHAAAGCEIEGKSGTGEKTKSGRFHGVGLDLIFPLRQPRHTPSLWGSAPSHPGLMRGPNFFRGPLAEQTFARHRTSGIILSIPARHTTISPAKR